MSSGMSSWALLAIDLRSASRVPSFIVVLRLELGLGAHALGVRWPDEAGVDANQLQLAQLLHRLPIGLSLVLVVAEQAVVAALLDQPVGQAIDQMAAFDEGRIDDAEIGLAGACDGVADQIKDLAGNAVRALRLVATLRCGRRHGERRGDGAAFDVAADLDWLELKGDRLEGLDI